MVWYSYLFINFSAFYYLQSKDETMKQSQVLPHPRTPLEFPCFLYDPVDVCNLISGSFVLLNPVCTSEISQFM